MDKIITGGVLALLGLIVVLTAPTPTALFLGVGLAYGASFHYINLARKLFGLPPLLHHGQAVIITDEEHRDLGLTVAHATVSEMSVDLDNVAFLVLNDKGIAALRELEEEYADEDE